MNDISQIIQSLTAALLHKLGDEVDLIFQYGSSLTGATHLYSDLDLSFVPVHDDTWESITVMVGETLIDLYPMSWSHLERMAEFRDISASVLLQHRILYQRSEAAAARMASLAGRLRLLMEPSARPEILRRALEIFQSTGYEYYLLRLQASAGHQAGSLQHAQSILRTVLHCLAVLNQACIDTRKLEQVCALPKLPPGFSETAARLQEWLEPQDVLPLVDALLDGVRELLVSEQRAVLNLPASFPDVFQAAYPELKRDLQGVMLGCQRRDMFSLKGSLLSLYHELSLGIAHATTGVAYSGFNSLPEYEQDLAALGFPPLLPYAAAGDFDGLHRQCQAFDRRLRSFLTEQGVGLNSFSNLQELQQYLETEFGLPLPSTA